MYMNHYCNPMYTNPNPRNVQTSYSNYEASVNANAGDIISASAQQSISENNASLQITGPTGVLASGNATNYSVSLLAIAPVTGVYTAMCGGCAAAPRIGATPNPA